MLNKSFAKSIVIGDISSNKVFSIGTYAVLLLVSLIMTIMNIITDKGILTLCTGIFAFLCVVNIGLALFGSVAASVAKCLFALEVLLMFTFFLVSGNPDGFSAIWICMLPSLGMFFFNRVRGTLLCVAMFLILVFFLWIPYGQTLLIYQGYTDTFKMRFPVLFVAFHMLAFLLETLRINAYKEMRRLQDYYHDLSLHDPLTHVWNRQGMYVSLESNETYLKAEKVGAAMFDIDDFKQVNDRYGHDVGDVVLKEFSAILNTVLADSVVCRWGGEEFVAVFCGDSFDFSLLEKVRTEIANHSFYDQEKRFNISVSVGVSMASDFDLKNVDALITKADDALYQAKRSGKNRIVHDDDLLKIH